MSDEKPAQPHKSPDPAARGSRGTVRGDTIVALATAAGRAAVAVVRVSGPRAAEIGKGIVHPWPDRPRALTRCEIRRTTDGAEVIDHGLAVFFPAPRSYTGEDLLELHIHGGSYITDAVVSALVGGGARPAVAGEFTERAVINGKQDLLRAEAIGELIDARSHAAHRLAMQGISGMLASQFASLRAGIVEVEALLAFDIDFPEEDHGPIARSRVAEAATALEDRLARLIGSAPLAAIAQHGAVVVLAGPPNAGKSSLLNALAGQARAIVSEEPGTTRDAIEVLLDADPWPIRLVDTAGIRDDAGTVEQLGIEVSERYLRGADVIVACAETDAARALVAERIRNSTHASVINVATKSDLRPRIAGGTAISVSATTGEGVEALRRAIETEVSARAGGEPDATPVIANARQRAAIEAALRELREFSAAWRSASLPSPVAATHLKAAASALDHLIGAIDVDAVFADVFSRFCIGK